jgi:hypothetical protein
MSRKARIKLLFGLTALCGVLAGALVLLSPNPLPSGNAQLLAAFITLFGASGAALVRELVTGPTRKQGGRLKGAGRTNPSARRANPL